MSNTLSKLPKQFLEKAVRSQKEKLKFNLSRRNRALAKVRLQELEEALEDSE